MINIRICEIQTERIGHLLLNSELYFCKKQKNIDKNKNKTFDIFYAGEFISNKYFFSLLKKKIKIYPYFFFSIFHKVAKKFRINNLEVSEIKQSFDKHDHLELFKPFIEIPNQDVNTGWRVLEKYFSTPRDIFEKKIVFFSLRDSFYLNKEFPNKDWSYHNYRDVDSDKFILAADILAEKGYKVFRIGKYVEKKFKSKHPNVIDYANSNYRSDFLDIFLGKISKFGLSTGTGIENIATIFRKPLGIIHVPLEFSYFHFKNLITTRIHYSNKLNKNLTLSEIFEHGAKVNFKYNMRAYDFLNITLKQVEENEIRDFVIERLETLENDLKEFKNNPIQQEFWKIFKFNVSKYNITSLNNIDGYFSNTFLKKNDWFLK